MTLDERTIRTTRALLASAALVSPFLCPIGAPALAQENTAASPASATAIPDARQDAPPRGSTFVVLPPPTEDASQVGQDQSSGDGVESDEEEIVVIGQRDPNAVIGDIPPENQLGARDIRAYGAATIAELLEAISPQTESGRGRADSGPVVLLNGRRISGFRELRDLPPEAILRLDILPEEVALKYGYRADQRVVNIILRRRYRSTAVRLAGAAPTEGGRIEAEANVTPVMIFEGRRTAFNINAERSTGLTEDERDVAFDPVGPAQPDPRPFRSLLDSQRKIGVGGTYGRTILGDVSATVDGEIQWSDGRSLLGPSLTDPGEPLVRGLETASGRAAFALNGDKGEWRWSTTGGFALDRAVTETEREDETPALRTDRARSLSRNANADLLVQGPLLSLPAGKAFLAARLGGEMRDLESRSRTDGEVRETDLGRDRVSSSVNVDAPVARRKGALSALGNLSLNANADLEHLSDFGTLATLGAGAFWSPLERLNLTASWTREKGAPGLEQLGEPVLATPNTRVFDFVRGETALVEAITGGNPDLKSDTRHVLKVGGSLRPKIEELDIGLRADYVRSRTDDPISRFPGASAAIEAAFPDRFERNSEGKLVRIDLRPTNFQSAARDEMRWGVTLSKRLKSAGPPRSVIDQIRRLSRGSSPGAPDAPPPPMPDNLPPPPDDGEPVTMEGPGGEGDAAPPGEGHGDIIAGPPPGGVGGGPGPGPGGPHIFFTGGGPGGPRGGRVQFSLFHTLLLRDQMRIGRGLPLLDFLDGDAADGAAGRSRHRIDADAGYFNNGLGARLSLNWQSGSRVTGGESGKLRFSPLTKVDVSAFANLSEQAGLIMKHPWLRGSQLRLSVENLFDAKQKVRDAAGGTPVNYQPDLLDPQGRTLRISLRKLFSPAAAFLPSESGQRR